MKRSYISGNTRVTTFKTGSISVCETEYVGDGTDEIIVETASSSGQMMPRGDRAARMKELIKQGTDKQTLRYMLEREGYTFNPSSVFHSEFARLSKK